MVILICIIYYVISQLILCGYSGIKKARIIMKRIAFIVLLSITLCSCTILGIGSESPEKAAEEIQNQIKDSEKLKGLFCEYALTKDNSIDREIESAFDFIDGDIVSFDEPFTAAAGSIETKSYGADTKNIVTSEGTYYTMSFNGEFRNDNDKSVEGVRYIKIINETKKKSSSDKNEYMKEIGLPEFSKEKMDEIF